MIDPKKFREYANDPAKFRDDLIVECDGQPVRFGDVVDPWQADDFAALDPGFQRCIGRHVDGAKMRAYLERPRGHSKTSDLAMMSMWALTFAPHQICGFAYAADRDQSRLLRDAIAKLIRLNPWLGQILSVQNYVVRNIAGSHPGRDSELRIESSQVESSWGILAEFIIVDELVHWQGDDALWTSIVSSAAKKSNSMLVVISNAGVGRNTAWQWHVRETCRENDNWYFSRLDGPQASWIGSSQLSEQERMLSRRAFERLVLNKWTDATEEPLLTWDLIVKCHDTNCLWPHGQIPEGSRPELYIGIDVGRTQDRTVIWTIELDRGVALTREIKVLHKVPFSQQRSEITSRINRHVVAVRIDKGAIGYQLAEEIETLHPRVAQGVQLTSGRQGQIALAVKTRFEQRNIRIPNDPVLNSDLQLVEEIETVGGLPRIVTNHGPSGHADRFWAMALAISALPSEHKRKYPFALPRGVRARMTDPLLQPGVPRDVFSWN